MDEFTRQGLMLYASTSIPSSTMIDILDWLVMCHGGPQHIRSDNGPEFVANKVKQWISHQGSQTIYIEPGHPWENPFVERFIGTLKHDCLSRHLFENIPEAQDLLDNWRIEYNAYRSDSRQPINSQLIPFQERACCCHTKIVAFCLCVWRSQMPFDPHFN